MSGFWRPDGQMQQALFDAHNRIKELEAQRDALRDKEKEARKSVVLVLKALDAAHNRIKELEAERVQLLAEWLMNALPMKHGAE